MECYPLAILEAMACKVPVIASEIGGIPDIIKDGVNGMLVQPGDQIELANTILKLIENPLLIDKLSNNAFNSVKKYSWLNIAKETETIYKELTED